MSASTRFWETRSLAELTPEEWEALCDGCGWCCIFKLEDEDTGKVFYTRVACKLLNLKTCRCMDYTDRLRTVPTCVRITPENVQHLTWLPETCAYRRLALGQELPEWHYLISGDRRAVHLAGASALGVAISEYGVDIRDLEDYILESGDEV